MSFLPYFLSTNIDAVYDMPLYRALKVLDHITEFEEIYGIISQKIDAERIKSRHKQFTLTPENVDLVSDSLKSLSDVYESEMKKRRL